MHKLDKKCSGSSPLQDTQRVQSAIDKALSGSSTLDGGVKCIMLSLLLLLSVSVFALELASAVFLLTLSLRCRVIDINFSYYFWSSDVLLSLLRQY